MLVGPGVVPLADLLPLRVVVGERCKQILILAARRRALHRRHAGVQLVEHAVPLLVGLLVGALLGTHEVAIVVDACFLHQ